MTQGLPHSPPGAPHPHEVDIVLEGPHPTRGMRQEPVSPCSSPFLEGETSATVWGRCQGGGKQRCQEEVSGPWRTLLGVMSRWQLILQGPWEPQASTELLWKTRRACSRQQQKGGVMAPSHSSTVERRQREEQGQIPVLSQVEQELPPSSFPSPLM